MGKIIVVKYPSGKEVHIPYSKAPAKYKEALRQRSRGGGSTYTPPAPKPAPTDTTKLIGITPVETKAGVIPEKERVTTIFRRGARFERIGTTAQLGITEKEWHETAKAQAIHRSSVKQAKELQSKGYIPVSAGIVKKLGMISKREYEKSKKDTSKIYYAKPEDVKTAVELEAKYGEKWKTTIPKHPDIVPVRLYAKESALEVKRFKAEHRELSAKRAYELGMITKEKFQKAPTEKYWFKKGDYKYAKTIEEVSETPMAKAGFAVGVQKFGGLATILEKGYAKATGREKELEKQWKQQRMALTRAWYEKPSEMAKLTTAGIVATAGAMALPALKAPLLATGALGVGFGAFGIAKTYPEAVKGDITAGVGLGLSVATLVGGSLAVSKGIQQLRWYKAKPKTFFKEVVTKPSGKIKESFGTAETRFMGKKYPSVFKQKWKTTPITEDLTKGTGVSGIITKVGKKKVGTIVATKFLSKDIITKGGVPDLSAQASISKYVTQLGTKLKTGWLGGKSLIKKVTPDISATLGVTLTEKKQIGIVGGLTKILRPTTTKQPYTFIPATKTTTATGGVAPKISDLISASVKTATKPVMKTTPISITPAITAGIKSLEKPAVITTERAYFSRVGTKQPKYVLQTRVMRRKPKVSEKVMAGLAFEQMKKTKAKAVYPQTTLSMQKARSALLRPLVAFPATKQLEMQKLKSLQMALQTQALQQRSLQRVVPTTLTVGKVFPPTPPSKIITIPPIIAGAGGWPDFYGARRWRLPTWWKYWERRWPVATSPKEIAKAFGWHPVHRAKKKKKKRR